MRNAIPLLLLVAACSEQAVEVTTAEKGHEFPLASPEFEQGAVAVEPPPQADPPDWSAKVGATPYQCEEFEVHVDKKGRTRYRRHRADWDRSDRKRFKKLVRMVAREMGAEPRLISTWALRESTLTPDAIHVLNHDLEGASRAWSRHRWSDTRAVELRSTMEDRGARHPDYWAAKAELSRISTFKDNRYYYDQVEFDVHLPTGEVVRDQRSRWAYGYGAFGFNPTYFLPLWDAEAPPWVFCDADGIVATVTAVWAARNALNECKSLGFPGTYEVVNRRFSSGSCKERPSRVHGFRRRARSTGLDYAAPAKLGTKWPQEGSDRAQIVAHMRARAREEGLLPDSAEATDPSD